MSTIRKIKKENSLYANAIVRGVVIDLVKEIKKYLDEKHELSFRHTVNRSFADEEMTTILKRDEIYLVVTVDNATGCECHEYDIEDFGSVSVYDLIWIMEQIEIQAGV